jgi:nucleotide-binding universal stress UspA family protein
MNEISRILIAYDGSACSDAALNDLRRAGLSTSLEAWIVSVAYSFVPSDNVADDELLSPAAAAMVGPAQAHAQQAIENARDLAERGAKFVKTEFPHWTVSHQAVAGSPAWSVIDMAVALSIDLVVIGSHRHSSAGGRLILGSVSQRVLHEAPCSVRVARCSVERRKGPVRIVVGFANSHDAEAAVEAVAARTWPPGSEARVITTCDTSETQPNGFASERLRASGLNISEIVRKGEPAHLLINEAEAWSADSIFVGTRDLHGFRHFLYGSVSSAVAARAQCSVEVARAGHKLLNLKQN